jgi:hypothetical protein
LEARCLGARGLESIGAPIGCAQFIGAWHQIGAIELLAFAPTKKRL